LEIKLADDRYAKLNGWIGHPNPALNSVSSTKITKWRFSEDKYLAEIRDYIAHTYSEHYSAKKLQAFDLIASAGHADGFCLGSILKYAARFGKKNGRNRKDLLKIVHYALLQLWICDNFNGDENADQEKARKEEANPQT
jgi:hypothetical protein